MGLLAKQRYCSGGGKLKGQETNEANKRIPRWRGIRMKKGVGRQSGPNGTLPVGRISGRIFGESGRKG